MGLEILRRAGFTGAAAPSSSTRAWVDGGEEGKKGGGKLFCTAAMPAFDCYRHYWSRYFSPFFTLPFLNRPLPHFQNCPESGLLAVVGVTGFSIQNFFRGTFSLPFRVCQCRHDPAVRRWGVQNGALDTDVPVIGAPDYGTRAVTGGNQKIRTWCFAAKMSHNEFSQCAAPSRDKRASVQVDSVSSDRLHLQYHNTNTLGGRKAHSEPSDPSYRERGVVGGRKPLGNRRENGEAVSCMRCSRVLRAPFVWNMQGDGA